MYQPQPIHKNGKQSTSMRQVKIVCTVGPASESPEVLEQLIDHGMNVARLNMSHGSQAWHEGAITTLRKVAKRKGMPIAILVDLQGPRIRVGSFVGGGMPLEPGQSVNVVGSPEHVRQQDQPLSDIQRIPIRYPALTKDIRQGARILMDDGLIELVVKKVQKKHLLCTVKTGGILKPHKGVNFPGSQLSTPALTEKDLDDLRFALAHHVDYIALSFVRSPDDVNRLKKRIKSLGKDVPVIAKIERSEAVKTLDHILHSAEGVMIARGDLAIEMSPEDIPVLQKRIIASANSQHRFVITATQMLESMTAHRTPTRAEATDVANAVFDGTDAVMLSAETSTGRYPTESVKVMDRIIRKAEGEESFRRDLRLLRTAKECTVPEAICEAAATAAKAIKAKAIVALTESGNTARLISHHRPTVPIVALTSSEQIRRQMALFWGVLPYVMTPHRDTDQRIQEAQKLIKQRGLARRGDRLVILTGVPAHHHGRTNLLEIHEVE